MDFILTGSDSLKCVCPCQYAAGNMSDKLTPRRLCRAVNGQTSKCPFCEPRVNKSIVFNMQNVSWRIGFRIDAFCRLYLEGVKLGFLLLQFILK